MPSIMIAKHDGVVLLDLELDPGRSYTLGRSPKNDIHLEAPSISRLHAIIFHHKGAWLIADLNSSKGIKDDSGTVDNAEFVDGEWISLGPAFVWYRDERPEQGHMPVEKQRSRNKGQAIHLKLDNGEQVLFDLSQRRFATLGTSDDCDIVLKDAGLNTLELILFRQGSRWHARSLGAGRIEDPEGQIHANCQLALNESFRSGVLTMTLLTMEVLPRIERSVTSDMGLGEPDDQLMIDMVDLEAAAKSGKKKGPEQPNSS